MLTQCTRDGGADILLLNDETNGVQAIIECKKYARNRTLGVIAVRTLIGAAVDWDVRRAYLVTTSDFSSVARFKAIDYKKRGYEIDLIAASDILRLLQVYNEQLPPLDKLDDEIRRSIIEFNSLEQ